MKKDKPIAATNTKQEILDAYNKLLTQIQEERPMTPKEEKKKEEEKVIVSAASQNSTEQIIKNLTNVKLDISKSLESLGESLISEFKKLTDLQKAIEIETRYLEDIHGIKVNTDSLAALIHAQREKEQQFSEEMETKRREFDQEREEKQAQWKKEQENYLLTKKDTEEKTKKEREREEEEYQYNKTLIRKKDHDEYEARKADLEKQLNEKRIALEKEFSGREANIAAKEKEYQELKIKVEAFPKELEKVVQETEKSLREKLEFKYKLQTDLSAKEIEGERKLNKQIILSLQEKIKEQEELIRQLTVKSNEAGSQVQDIAIKAIEGASRRPVFATHFEKGNDRQKAEMS